jgi:bifunctional UDP-N-acetylglucosamine pyrophosphorylase/glucosamine-1-phosphate N-acetyltransferase
MTSGPRPLTAVVLAAGEGTRMRSAIPKVLHPLCGRPMILHLVDALTSLGPEVLDRIVVVVGHGAELVTKALAEGVTGVIPVDPVHQERQRGTGDAVQVALAALADELTGDEDVLVTPGDTPLLRPDTLAALIGHHRAADPAATVLTARVADPTGYGRVLRDRDGRVDRIVEHRDATEAERAVDEVNTSIYCFRRSLLAPALRRITPDNSQGEYYLTDAVAFLRLAGHRVDALVVPDSLEAGGINDRAQLAEAERLMRRRVNAHWMDAGVTMVDPERTYIDVGVTLGADVRLLPGVLLEGRTVVGDRCEIGPDSRLIDTIVGEDAVISYSQLRESEIGDGAAVGPFASLRPGTVVGRGAKVGTFVETKNAELRPGAKAPHLAYVGDAVVGEGANLGAGTITANYDGAHKHRTTIGAGVHTGSNTVLVAPVELGPGAYTAAGAVVNRDVPANALARGVPATIIEGWAVGRPGSHDPNAETASDETSDAAPEG